ncbi:UNVERIFIED_CONTAM: hypothetical protein FKN15_067785 [Acipenser sinensis]
MIQLNFLEPLLSPIAVETDSRGCCGSQPTGDRRAEDSGKVNSGHVKGKGMLGAGDVVEGHGGTPVSTATTVEGDPMEVNPQNILVPFCQCAPLPLYQPPALGTGAPEPSRSLEPATPGCSRSDTDRGERVRTLDSLGAGPEVPGGCFYPRGHRETSDGSEVSEEELRNVLEDFLSSVARSYQEETVAGAGRGGGEGETGGEVCPVGLAVESHLEGGYRVLVVPQRIINLALGNVGEGEGQAAAGDTGSSLEERGTGTLTPRAGLLENSPARNPSESRGQGSRTPSAVLEGSSPAQAGGRGVWVQNAANPEGEVSIKTPSRGQSDLHSTRAEWSRTLAQNPLSSETNLPRYPSPGPEHTLERSAQALELEHQEPDQNLLGRAELQSSSVEQRKGFRADPELRNQTPDPGTAQKSRWHPDQNQQRVQGSQNQLPVSPRISRKGSRVAAEQGEERREGEKTGREDEKEEEEDGGPFLTSDAPPHPPLSPPLPPSSLPAPSPLSPPQNDSGDSDSENRTPKRGRGGGGGGGEGSPETKRSRLSVSSDPRSWGDVSAATRLLLVSASCPGRVVQGSTGSWEDEEEEEGEGRDVDVVGGESPGLAAGTLGGSLVWRCGSEGERSEAGSEDEEVDVMG